MVTVILTDNFSLSLLHRFPCDAYFRVISTSEATAICRQAIGDALLKVSVQDMGMLEALSTVLRIDLTRHEHPGAATGIGGMILVARYAEPAVGRAGGIEFIQAEVV